ncbi:MAG: LytR C-terminal domain-containing protein [Candidatus Neomarinimicrobiota bacterium]|nr:LytR C-terminal domain-containing protein [Candidatus Neomarinimicrobiota bacterium]
MAKINSKKSSRFSLFRTGRSKVKKAKQMGIINAGIAVMSVLLFAFIFSFSSRQSQSGVPIRAVTFPTTDEVPKLATEIYEANPILDIEVEILNGCGESGIAARFSEFLRDKRVDVVRSENADNFDYTKTVLIQRNENTSGLKYVADALKFDMKNSARVMTAIDSNSDVDITLVIGKDFRSINSIKSYLKN